MHVSDLTQVIAFLTAVAGVVAKFAADWQRTRTMPEKLSLVQELARVAVAAAEKAGEATNATGADKFEVASDFLVAAAAKLKVKVTPAEVTGFIHAALRELDEFAKLSIDVPDAAREVAPAA